MKERERKRERENERERISSERKTRADCYVKTSIILLTSNRVKSLVVTFKPAIVIWSFVGSTPILLEWAKKGKREMER